MPVCSVKKSMQSCGSSQEWEWNVTNGQERTMRVRTETAQPCEAGAVRGLEAEEKPRAEALAGQLVKESPSVELRLWALQSQQKRLSSRKRTSDTDSVEVLKALEKRWWVCGADGSKDGYRGSRGAKPHWMRGEEKLLCIMKKEILCVDWPKAKVQVESLTIQIKTKAKKNERTTNALFRDV